MIRKTHSGLALTVLAATALASCKAPDAAKPAAADTAKVATAVKADFGEMVAALNAHDAATAVSHDASGYVGMFHGTPNVNGPVEDMAMTTKQVKHPPDAHIEVNNISVDVPASGEVAVVHASYKFTGTDPKTKKKGEEDGNWTLGYRLIDGVWRVTWSVVSDIGTGAGTVPGVQVPAGDDDTDEN